MQKTATPSNTDDEIDLLALLGTLLDYRYLIIATTLTFAFMGILYALLATPIYQANAMIQIEQKKGNLVGLESMDGLFPSQSQADTEIQILKSRMIIGQAVDDLHLDVIITSNTLPVIGDKLVRRFNAANPGQLAPSILGLNQFNWGGAQLIIDNFELEKNYLNQSFTLKAEENGQYSLFFDGQLLLKGQLGQVAKAQGITIFVKQLTANPGSEFTLTKISRLQAIINYQNALQVGENPKQSGILRLSLENSNPLFAQTVLDKIAHTYVQLNIKRLSAEASNSLDFLKKQLPSVRDEMQEAEDKLNAFQMSSQTADITIETQSVLEQVVKLDTEISALKLQQLEMNKLFTKEHPSYQTLLSKIAQLEKNKQALEKQVGTLPEVQQKLLRLKRNVEVSAEIYTQLLQKVQELNIAQASTVGNVRIIDQALADTSRPVAPKRLLIVAIATLLGLLLSVFAAIVHSLLNRGVESIEEVEALDLPVYAAIPFSSSQIDALDKKKSHAALPLLALNHPEDISVEALRNLHTSLHFTLPNAKNNIIMISGPSPKVGKSFISANLAALMAQSGKRVLLIDADMRRGHLHQYLGDKREFGLSSLLSGQAQFEAKNHLSHVENLSFIPRGTNPPNPAELLLNPCFSELLKTFSTSYDVVIIDTPPILAVTDAAIIGQHVGSAFLAVRFGLNPSAEINAAIKRFNNSHIELKGAILNATYKKASRNYQYGYDTYQYQYQSHKD